MHDQRDEITRCEREIESITAQLLAGSMDMHGLLLALQDWGCELRLIERLDLNDWVAQYRLMEKHLDLIDPQNDTRS